MIEKSGKIKCAFCGGTGIQPRSLKSRCFSCRGKGEVEFKGPVITCPSCKGTGKALNSPMLSCLRCKGIGVVEKDKSEGNSADPIPSPSASYGAGIIGERLGEITKRLRWVRKETEKKEKEIEKRLKPISARGGKESIWLKKLANKIKKEWEFLWKG